MSCTELLMERWGGGEGVEWALGISDADTAELSRLLHWALKEFKGVCTQKDSRPSLTRQSVEASKLPSALFSVTIVFCQIL